LLQIIDSISVFMEKLWWTLFSIIKYSYGS
jgi:hypothetical protein